MAKSVPIYLQTTEVSALKSMAECQAELVKAQARRVMQEYDANGSIVGMAFTIVRDGVEIPYKMPVRVDAVFQKIQNQGTYSRESKADQDRQQAERVAWRQLLYWLKAQIAMIDTRMVEPAEVFMPYRELPSGQTLYEKLSADWAKALPAPADCGGDDV